MSYHSYHVDVDGPPDAAPVLAIRAYDRPTYERIVADFEREREQRLLAVHAARARVQAARDALARRITPTTGAEPDVVVRAILDNATRGAHQIIAAAEQRAATYRAIAHQ